MSRIISTTVYTLDELSDAARENARSWYREHALNDDWYQNVFDGFTGICGILGVDIKRYTVPLLSGKNRQQPCIWFSGFCHQGDGACFEGDYAYQPQAVYRIREHYPEDADLHRIADLLQAIQLYNNGELRATIRHHGQHIHGSCMTIGVERHGTSGQDMATDSEAAITDAMRELARWLYNWLESEYGWQTSPAIVDEDIIDNEYTFTGSGQRFG
ncbi:MULTISPECIES: antitoxin of toxin-antitoxin stability system [Citrobacter freundii complex]|uniref:antitoxin of toxin-antitoxin stability system n=1 Tax=Citrobacter freundii complex TaxID=1344959 RepID=UPI001F37B7A9|nr:MULTISPECIES: antitoxin of toxin-antitoxin stability system [Citrobacter freundii complex]WFV17786.1 antitoxin of toxin-antitoxin stability system [Citrobacter braakii]